MRLVATLAAGCAALLTVLDAAPARAVQVTWTLSGTASVIGGTLDYFPNGSPYSVSVTYESSTVPTGINGTYTYDSAILSVSFDSPTYHPTISLAPPNLSQIGLDSAFMSFRAGASSGATSSNPGFFLVLGDFNYQDPRSLPIAPPPPGVAGGGYLDLYVDAGLSLFANVPISSIHYSVPEPALAALFLSALALRCVRSAR
jgi:hypothetical protein